MKEAEIKDGFIIFCACCGKKIRGEDYHDAAKKCRREKWRGFED